MDCLVADRLGIGSWAGDYVRSKRHSGHMVDYNWWRMDSRNAYRCMPYRPDTHNLSGIQRARNVQMDFLRNRMGNGKRRDGCGRNIRHSQHRDRPERKDSRIHRCSIAYRWRIRYLIDSLVWHSQIGHCQSSRAYKCTLGDDSLRGIQHLDRSYMGSRRVHSHTIQTGHIPSWSDSQQWLRQLY